MMVSVEELHNYVMLNIGENVTFENAADFQIQLERALQFGAKSLVVDLGDVSYICSSALGSLIFLFRRVGVAGGDVYVVTPHTKLRRVFELVHIPRLVTFVPSRDRAHALIDGSD